MRRFDWKKTIIVGFGFLGISVIWPIFNQFLPLFLQAGNPEFERQLLAAGRQIPDIVGFALPPSLALFIMTWDNLINVFVQPWVGERSDRTWNRFGRRKPWILLGLPFAVVGFVVLPFAQTALALAVFILITNLGMALFRSPTVAWLGDLYTPEERSKANGIINLMGGLGAILAFVLGGIVFSRFGRPAPFLMGAVILVLAMAAALALVREPRERRGVAGTGDVTPASGVIGNLRRLFAASDRSGVYVLLAILLWFMGFQALEAGLSSFAVFSLGIEAGRASILAGAVPLTFALAAWPAGLFGTRWGRRRIIMIGLMGLAVLLGAGTLVIQNQLTFVLVLVLAGFFWALVNVNSLPLVYDYGDERKIGAYTGLYYFSSQLAAVLGPTLGGVVVDVLGDEYRWLFPFSMVFMALAWLAMKQVMPLPLDRSQVVR